VQQTGRSELFGPPAVNRVSSAKAYVRPSPAPTRGALQAAEPLQGATSSSLRPPRAPGGLERLLLACGAVTSRRIAKLQRRLRKGKVGAAQALDVLVRVYGGPKVLAALGSMQISLVSVAHHLAVLLPEKAKRIDAVASMHRRDKHATVKAFLRIVGIKRSILRKAMARSCLAPVPPTRARLRSFASAVQHSKLPPPPPRASLPLQPPRAAAGPSGVVG